MSSLDRRRFLAMTAGAGALTAVPAWMQVALANDLQKAKAEGEAVFYANITAVEPVMAAFQQDTGIKGLYTRISSSKFIPTILTEAQAGKLLADVVQSPLPMVEMLAKNKILAPYTSPAAKDYPAWATSNDLYTSFGIEYVSYLYNTDLVKSEDVPQNYADLGNPKWRDKIVMADPATHASTIAWLIALKEQYFKTEDDWMAYVKALAANKPMFVASFGPTPAPIESGEKLVAISMPKYIVTKAPAPLGWGPKEGPLFGAARAIAVTESAPHPAAARAFMDFWLSKEAMQILASKVGEYVLAPGVFPNIPGIDKVEVKPARDLSDKELKKWGREFKTIFSGR
ncbi:ABC transporter substrate-binding protein [Orrella sp. 11846]|uniref:ABC transporter substrate-binding protein n=1 Tax=Orrella sp. 11846 TaxID=3409913 RepID=UPI003B5AF51A